jgi:hypothetical protein
MADHAITERQLEEYEPRTTSGAALKERLEAASGSDDNSEGNRKVLR